MPSNSPLLSPGQPSFSRSSKWYFFSRYWKSWSASVTIVSEADSQDQACMKAFWGSWKCLETQYRSHGCIHCQHSILWKLFQLNLTFCDPTESHYLYGKDLSSLQAFGNPAIPACCWWMKTELIMQTMTSKIKVFGSTNLSSSSSVTVLSLVKRTLGLMWQKTSLGGGMVQFSPTLGRTTLRCGKHIQLFDEDHLSTKLMSASPHLWGQALRRCYKKTTGLPSVRCLNLFDPNDL